MTDPHEFNRRAWDRIAAGADKWFRGATGEEIQRAREGDFQIKLTPTRNVPTDWLGDVRDRQVLCLAAGGGQQAPLLAAAGARVTVVDVSPAQLERDREIARRESLELRTLPADMRDLPMLADSSFDLIINPTSVCYIADPERAWQEAARLLRPGGSLLAGMILPHHFLFDPIARDRGQLDLVYQIPYCDLDLPEAVRERVLSDERPIEFGHSLETLISGQLRAGLCLTGFYTDRWGDSDPLSDRIDVFAATRVSKRPLG